MINSSRKRNISSELSKKKNSQIFNIHIQDPKVNLKNFDAIVAPEHDGLKGDNIYNSKPLSKEQINYIKEKFKNVAVILQNDERYCGYFRRQNRKYWY